jgi:DNA-binding transcriptional ArsR family regulator
MDTDLERMARVFTALGNSTRLELLSELASLPPSVVRSVSSLADAVEVSRFTASHHLAVLRSAGLIDGRKVGLMLEHRLNAHTLARIEDWCLSFDSMETTGASIDYLK